MKSTTLLLFTYLFYLTIQACENNGTIYPNSTLSEELCICTQNFIGKTCNISSYELTQEFTAVPIGKNYSFVYFIPLEDVLFEFGLTICSQNKDQIIDFLLFVQKEQLDNKIDIDPTNSYAFIEEVVGGHHGCKKISSSIIFSVERKDNNEPPKIVFGLKQIGKNIEIEEKFLMVKVEVNEFCTIDFLIRSMPSILIIITILMILSLAISLRKKFLERKTSKREKEKKQKYIHEIMPSQKYQNFVEENESVNDEENANTCAICLCEFQMEENIRKTPCGHIYHENCLDSWCNSHLNCPICRKNFEIEEKKQNIEMVNEELRENNTNIRENML